MNRYNVYRTGQFDELWDQIKSTDVIDSATGETELESLSKFLSVDPRYFPEFEAPGERVDLRWAILSRAESVRVEFGTLLLMMTRL